MAKINSGILGGFSGTIKNVKGYRRNGKSIIQKSDKFNANSIAPKLAQLDLNCINFWKCFKNFESEIEFLCSTFGYSWPLDVNNLMKLNITKFIYSNPLYLPGIHISQSAKPLLIPVSATQDIPTQNSIVLAHEMLKWRYSQGITLVDNPIIVGKPNAINSTSVPINSNTISTGAGWNTVGIGRTRGRALVVRNTVEQINNSIIFASGTRIM
ncbi:MAG: hypothetical protein HC912_04150 [Saprospiraceae bacterium]|nr:hypothetical protein [Saprospiraceae bacterium]